MKKIPAVLRHLCNKIVIIVGFGIFYCTGGIDQLGGYAAGNGRTERHRLAGHHAGHFRAEQPVPADRCPAVLLPAAGTAEKDHGKNPAANVALSVTGTVLAAGLLVISSILMVDATNTPFLYTKF